MTITFFITWLLMRIRIPCLLLPRSPVMYLRKRCMLTGFNWMLIITHCSCNSTKTRVASSLMALYLPTNAQIFSIHLFIPVSYVKTTAYLHCQPFRIISSGRTMKSILNNTNGEKGYSSGTMPVILSSTLISTLYQDEASQVTHLCYTTVYCMFVATQHPVWPWLIPFYILRVIP